MRRIRKDHSGGPPHMRSIASDAWPVLLFALTVLVGGLIAMAVLADDVSADAITALAAAVLGVVGTHVGHIAGHHLALRQSAGEPVVAAVDALGQQATNADHA